MNKMLLKILAVVLATACSASYCQAETALPKLVSEKVAAGIYMLTGNGGNIGLLTGKEGTVVIDDQYAPMTVPLLAEIKRLGATVPKFVINTHYHQDHTGGNENLGKMGSIIVAQDNVRKTLSKDGFIKAFNIQIKAAPPEALPMVTFTEAMSLHLNGDTLQIKHIPNAHTDGDSLIFFKNANVLHAGDLYFNGFWPFIDVEHGGSLKGMIAAVDMMLELADENTQIIPGHGPLSRREALIHYREALAVAYERLSALKKQGKTLDDVIAAKPLADLDKAWGQGFLSTDKWLSIVYPSL